MKFLRKHSFSLLIILTLFCASSIRLYHLGTTPAGLTWDEAAIGYNGFAVGETLRDEWFQILPISFKSFGDYKAPLAIYLSGFFTHFLDLSVISVRLPFALAGILSVLGIILLVNFLLENFQQQKKNRQLSGQGRVVAVLAGFIMTFSPWHIHFSRAGFESGIALCLLIWGVLLLLWSAIKAKSGWRKWTGLVVSLVLLSSTLYTYHSAKIVTPLLLLGLTYLLWRRFSISVRLLATYCLGFIVFSSAFLFDSIFGKGLTRAGVTIFSQNFGVLDLFKVFLSNLYAHLTPGFWLFSQADTLRHSSSVYGVLLPTTFLFVSLGLVLLFIFRKRTPRYWHHHSLLLILGIYWVFVGLLPAIIGTGVPHPNRALLALPGLIILFSVVCQSTLDWISLKNISRKWQMIGFLTFMMIHLLFWAVNTRYYYRVYPGLSSNEWQEGYLEMMTIVQDYELGNESRPPVGNILINDTYGQAYIYTLFSKKLSPIAYQNGALINYEFTHKNNIGDLARKNALIVTVPGDEFIDQKKPNQTIFGSDGQVRFMIFYTGDKYP